MTTLFDEALLRLKQATGLLTDKEIAAFLGMSPTAFNGRKSRGKFPVDRVYVVASKRPDLNIDAEYVVTGLRSSQPQTHSGDAGGFNGMLGRLKVVVGMHQDGQVAELFGMTSSAFNRRKTRERFPADRLYATAAQRPDLGIDVAYILTGHRSSEHAAPHPAPQRPADDLTALRRDLEATRAEVASLRQGVVSLSSSIEVLITAMGLAQQTRG